MLNVKNDSHGSETGAVFLRRSAVLSPCRCGFYSGIYTIYDLSADGGLSMSTTFRNMKVRYR